MIPGRRIVRCGGDRLLERFSGSIHLPGVHHDRAHVVVVLAGIGRIELGGFLKLRLRLVDLDRIGGKNIVYARADLIDFKKDADPVKIERELMRVIPRQEWLAATYRIVDHGRAVCKAQNPNCRACVLRDLCPVSRV